jgi:ubiquitin-like domain-containing CTD phosphatase 1
MTDDVPEASHVVTGPSASPVAELAAGPALVAKWSGKEYPIASQATWSIGDLKRKLYEVTRVDPKRQKFIGLVKGKAPEDDSVLLSSLTLLKPDGAFMMMGTIEAEIQREQEMLEASDDIVNDLDATYTNEDSERWHKDLKHREKLKEVALATKITLINPPLRPKTRLLVLGKLLVSPFKRFRFSSRVFQTRCSLVI